MFAYVQCKDGQLSLSSNRNLPLISYTWTQYTTSMKQYGQVLAEVKHSIHLWSTCLIRPLEPSCFTSSSTDVSYVLFLVTLIHFSLLTMLNDDIHRFFMESLDRQIASHRTAIMGFRRVLQYCSSARVDNNCFRTEHGLFSWLATHQIWTRGHVERTERRRRPQQRLPVWCLHIAAWTAPRNPSSPGTHMTASCPSANPQDEKIRMWIESWWD